MIYEPREDSFLLEKWVKKYAKKGMRVLDVGCGSGILSVAAKENGATVLAVDVNPKAVRHTKGLGVNAVVSDLFSKVEGKFDLIIFNPPYLPDEELEDEDSKRITTGGKEGFEILERFFSKVKTYLNPNGGILIIISSLTKPKEVEKIIKKESLNFKILDKEKFFMEELGVYEVRTL